MERDSILELVAMDEEEVDVSIYEVLEDECEVKRMDVAVFKQMAKDAGLIKDDEEEKEDEPAPPELHEAFEVVEE